MAKALAAIDERKLDNIRLHHGDATDVLGLAAGRERSRASICSIPIRGRSGGTGSGASCRTTASQRSRGSLSAGGEFRFASDIADYAAWTLLRLARSHGFFLDRGAGRRLAEAVAGLVRHALRGQGEARRPRAELFDFQKDVESLSVVPGRGRANPRRLRAGAPARTAPRVARSTATASRSWRRQRRSPASRCPWRSAAT